MSHTLEHQAIVRGCTKCRRGPVVHAIWQPHRVLCAIKRARAETKMARSRGRRKKVLDDLKAYGSNSR